MTGSVRLAFLADGESVHTKRWVTYFVGREFDVHLITSKAKPINGVKIHELEFSLARNAWLRAHASFPLRVLKIRKEVREISPDVLHAHYITNYGVCGALTGFHPLVLSPWGDDITIDPERSMVKNLLVRFALGRADLVHTASAYTRLLELGCDPRKIFVQQWGVDTRVFSPRARSESLRSSLGVDSGYLVLCARYWESLYNVEVFVKAVPLVLEKINNARFVMLGGGSLGASLKELAKRLGVYSNIVFVGRVPEEEMPKYLASADVYVDTYSPVRVDGSGHSVVVRGTSGVGQTTRQAMASGVPQILSARPGTRSLDWFSGLLYEGLNHRDLAEKIVQLLKSDKDREAIGLKSRKDALRVLDEKVLIEKWRGIYEVLGR
jgi:glycosyltransferase involved in cell wall biosynthesis